MAAEGEKIEEEQGNKQCQKGEKLEERKDERRREETRTKRNKERGSEWRKMMNMGTKKGEWREEVGNMGTIKTNLRIKKERRNN